jgi:hypothetical protein
MLTDDKFRQTEAGNAQIKLITARTCLSNAKGRGRRVGEEDRSIGSTERLSIGELTASRFEVRETEV